jgi:hypothetical protein
MALVRPNPQSILAQSETFFIARRDNVLKLIPAQKDALRVHSLQ